MERVERQPDLKKPANTRCPHQGVGGKGCAIYGSHPKGCKDLYCLWTKSTPDQMEEAMWPALSHVYVVGDWSSELLLVKVDPKFSNAHEWGMGAVIVRSLIARGYHLLIVADNSVHFRQGYGKPKPEKLVIDWVM